MSSVRKREFNLCDLRNYYEEQGRVALSEGGGISCSERTTVAAVRLMVSECAAEFRTVVDVGWGANLIYDAALVDLGKEVIGVDFTYNFLKLAAANYSRPLIQADARALPFAAESLEAVICSETV